MLFMLNVNTLIISDKLRFKFVFGEGVFVEYTSKSLIWNTSPNNLHLEKITFGILLIDNEIKLEHLNGEQCCVIRTNLNFLILSTSCKFGQCFSKFL